MMYPILKFIFLTCILVHTESCKCLNGACKVVGACKKTCVCYERFYGELCQKYTSSYRLKFTKHTIKFTKTQLKKYLSNLQPSQSNYRIIEFTVYHKNKTIASVIFERGNLTKSDVEKTIRQFDEFHSSVVSIEDVNECKESIVSCGEGRHCKNTNGSFLCARKIYNEERFRTGLIPWTAVIGSVFFMLIVLLTAHYCSGLIKIKLAKRRWRNMWKGNQSNVHTFTDCAKPDFNFNEYSPPNLPAVEGWNTFNLAQKRTSEYVWQNKQQKKINEQQFCENEIP